MTEEQIFNKYRKWRERVTKQQSRITEAIFKAQRNEEKLWKSCPHSWGVLAAPDRSGRGFGKQCRMCLALMDFAEQHKKELK